MRIPHSYAMRPFKSEPWRCYRELKPGVEREGHKLTDHVDYSEEEESCSSKSES